MALPHCRVIAFKQTISTSACCLHSTAIIWIAISPFSILGMWEMCAAQGFSSSQKMSLASSGWGTDWRTHRQIARGKAQTSTDSGWVYGYIKRSTPIASRDSESSCFELIPGWRFPTMHKLSSVPTLNVLVVPGRYCKSYNKY